LQIREAERNLLAATQKVEREASSVDDARTIVIQHQAKFDEALALREGQSKIEAECALRSKAAIVEYTSASAAVEEASSKAASLRTRQVSYSEEENHLEMKKNELQAKLNAALKADDDNATAACSAELNEVDAMLRRNTTNRRANSSLMDQSEATIEELTRTKQQREDGKCEVEAELRQCRRKLANLKSAESAAETMLLSSKAALQKATSLQAQASSELNDVTASHKQLLSTQHSLKEQIVACTAQIADVENRRERRLATQNHGMKRSIEEMRQALQRKAYAARDELLKQLEQPDFEDDFNSSDESDE